MTALLPISGGSLDDIPAPYEPTEQDWLDYRAVMDAADRLDAFNVERLD